MTHTESEIIVIGAGIVGLATARALQRQHPGAVVTVFDKETSVAAHQTGRNSGVIHSGLYYPPASQKAAMVKTGRELLFDFINEQEIPVDLCGKVVVATRPDEVTRLDGLKARGKIVDFPVNQAVAVLEYQVVLLLPLDGGGEFPIVGEAVFPQPEVILQPSQQEEQDKSE